MPMLSSPTTATGAEAHPSRPPFEVADIVREYGEAFRATHHVSHEQARVLRPLVKGPPVALEGNVEAGETCGAEQIPYNSCPNSHSPNGKGAARAKCLAPGQRL